MQAQVDIQRRINRIYHALSVIRAEAITPSIPISNGRVDFDVRCGGDSAAAQMGCEAQAAIGEVATRKDNVNKRLGGGFVEALLHQALSAWEDLLVQQGVLARDVSGS